MPKLQITDTVKSNSNLSALLRILEQLLCYVEERNESAFIQLCGQKTFPKLKDLKDFIATFPTSSFVLNTNELEIEYSIFLNYLSDAEYSRGHLPSRRTYQPVFIEPEYDMAALKFQGFNKLKYERNANLAASIYE